MKKALLSAALLLANAAATRASDPATAFSPEQVIQKSIAYHDPNGAWDTGRFELDVHTIYSEAFAKKRGTKTTDVAIVLSPGHEVFSYTRRSGGDEVVYRIEGGVGTATVNGSADISDEDRERFRIAEPEMYRDYCEYLYGMPMKLLDPGAILDPRVKRASFDDRDVLEVRVTYDPEVGVHTWYFYFAPDTFALVGYKFYKDESKNDGEYITFEGEIVDKASGLRLPKARAWYYNDGSGHLATDDIVSIRSSEG